MDPYSIVIIKDEEGNASVFMKGDIPDKTFVNSGIYDVSVVNRVGNSFDLSIKVVGSNYASLSFDEPYADKLGTVIVKKGDQNVELPMAERYGYELKGYLSDDGEKIPLVIPEVDFSGTKILSPYWEPKDVSIEFRDEDGNLINSVSAKYGSKVTAENPDIPKGYVFAGWQINGQPLEDNTINVNKEDTVTLVADFEPVEVETPEEQPEDEPVDDKALEPADNNVLPDGIMVYVIIALVGLLLITWIGIGIGRSARKRKARKERQNIAHAIDDTKTTIVDTEPGEDEKE